MKYLLAAVMLSGMAFGQFTAITGTLPGPNEPEYCVNGHCVPLSSLLSPSHDSTVVQVPQPSVTEPLFIEDTLYPATGLLYKQDAEGEMKMLCTVTAIEKTAKGYRFVTAAHCVADDDTEKKRVDVKKEFLFITLDETKAKEFMRAALVVAGYQHRGDDFSLLDVETKAAIPLVPLGVDVSDHSSHPIVNIASPQGMGKQTFLGTVSAPKLDRPVVANEINWTNAFLMQLPGTNGGSSGSAVVSLEQRAICGFLVGTFGGTSVVGIPVSRFKSFYEQFKAGKYKYYEPED